jgi:hypothetical protein
MKPWERDLLDHLVFLVMSNVESPTSEAEVREGLKRELSPYFRDESSHSSEARGRSPLREGLRRT